VPDWAKKKWLVAGSYQVSSVALGSGTARTVTPKSSMISELPPVAPQPSAFSPFLLVLLKDGPIESPAGPTHPVPGKISYAATTLAYVKGVVWYCVMTGSEILRTNPSVVLPVVAGTFR
jgi:hypothetical protein